MSFGMKVPRGGYRLVGSESDPLIVPRGVATEYLSIASPLEMLTFVAGDESGLRRLAQRIGRIGVPLRRRDGAEGEPLKDWRVAVADLDRALRVARCIIAQDWSSLTGAFRQQGREVTYEGVTVELAGQPAAWLRDSLRKLRVRGPEYAARCSADWLAAEIERHLAGRLHLSCEWMDQSPASRGTLPLWIWADPRTLLDAAWFSFGHLHGVETNESSETSARGCEAAECTRTVFVGGAGRRRDTRYCSTRCRVREHRRRTRKEPIIA